MAINLKNYTTEVKADRSVALIEALLVDFGATSIAKQYAELPPLVGRFPVGLNFIIEVKGNSQVIQMPVNVGGVAIWLRSKRPQSSDKAITEQALRIAWKQQYEILHLQLGQVEMQQREALAVFLADLFMETEGVTLYEKMKQTGYKLLT